MYVCIYVCMYVRMYLCMYVCMLLLLLLLLFVTFSVLVANPKQLLYTVANPASGLLNREKRSKKKSLAAYPPPPTPHTARSENIHEITRRIYRRYAGLGSVSRPYKDTLGSSTRPIGVASQNSTLLPSARASFPVSLLLSSPGDV